MLTEIKNGNRVFLEGILSEIDLKEVETEKDGKKNDTIRGVIKVRVGQEINKEPKTLEVPVHVYVNKITKAGSVNPSYTSMKEVMSSYKSIAASNLEQADRVRISGAQITMNEFYDKKGSFVSEPRIKASFVDKVTGDKFNPEATFQLTFVVGKMIPEVDKDGIETGRLKLSAVVPKYGGKVDVVPLYGVNPNVVDVISSSWNEGDTVSCNGKLDFTSKTEVYMDNSGFGDPIKKTKTISVSDIIITGGDAEPKEGELAIDTNEIKTALAARQEYLNSLKDKKAEPKAPAKNVLNDLGF